MPAKRKNLFLQKDVTIEHIHPSLTANDTQEIYEVPAGRSLVIDRVLYTNQTGLAQSDTNYVVINVLNAALVAASYSTKLTGGDGALTAGSQVKPTVSATVANVNAAAATKIKWNIAVTGTPTLPTGRIRIEGRLL